MCGGNPHSSSVLTTSKPSFPRSHVAIGALVAGFALSFGLPGSAVASPYPPIPTPNEISVNCSAGTWTSAVPNRLDDVGNTRFVSFDMRGNTGDTLVVRASNCALTGGFGPPDFTTSPDPVGTTISGLANPYVWTITLGTNFHTKNVIVNGPLATQIGSVTDSQFQFFFYQAQTPAPDLTEETDSAATSMGPAAIIQQVPVPASGSCDAVDDSELMWGTSLTGGWGTSWSDWVNGGQGGPVCTRTWVWRADNGWSPQR